MGKVFEARHSLQLQLLAANTAHLLDTLHVTKAVVLGHSTGRDAGSPLRADVSRKS